MAGRQTPMYIISGFLGSGKTTFLNKLLKLYRGKNIGIIVNEFGSISIDGTLIEADTGIQKTELNGGQIFCSCLSGSFVESIASYKDKELDILIVEASGLAKPSPLLEIVEWAEKKSDHMISYRGMIGIIDASRYLDLSSVLKTLEEQVAFSDRFIINKTDLVDQETLQKVLSSVQKISPGAWIETASYCDVDGDFMKFSYNSDRVNLIKKEYYKGWGPQGRPKPVLLKPLETVTITSLKNFLREYGKKTFRIKGYCDTKELGIVQINCVGEQIEVDPISDWKKTSSIPVSGIVVMFTRSNASEKVLQARWMLLTGDRATVK
ncbi:MAG: GTP-binding protein [Spirochaetia bacterium]|nr:GTP-binding protein [Spirochaetia bacterium]